MTPAEVLQPICSTDGTRPALLTPFGMDFKGHRWMAASDGHVAVALLVDRELRADGPDLAGKVLDLAPPPNFKANVAQLSKWAGPVRSEPCHGCGKDPYPTRPGTIFSGVLNRVLLARALATLPEGTAELRIGQAEPLTPYILRAPGWLAAIMPLVDKEVSEKFTELEPV